MSSDEVEDERRVRRAGSWPPDGGPFGGWPWFLAPRAPGGGLLGHPPGASTRVGGRESRRGGGRPAVGVSQHQSVGGVQRRRLRHHHYPARSRDQGTDRRQELAARPSRALALLPRIRRHISVPSDRYG